MNVHCSRCGEAHAVSASPRINVAERPEMKEAVRSGSLFVWECPHCGAQNLVRYPLLYHDPAERLMVWLLPEGPVAYIEGVREALDGLDGYTLRRVPDVGSLIEKVLIFDAGLDDIVIEMCKYVTTLELAEKDPAVRQAPFKFYRVEGPDNDLVLSFPREGRMQAVHVGFNVYEDCRGILARHPAVQAPQGFARIDADWLGQYFR